MSKKADIEQLQKHVEQRGYSFIVGETGVSNVPVAELARGKKPTPKPKEQVEAEFRRIETDKRRGVHELSRDCHRGI